MKKFYCALAAAAMALTANATDYYLIGGFNSWTQQDASCKFEAGSNADEYVLTYAGTLTSGFKINDGTWTNDAVNFGSNGKNIEVGEVYTMNVGGSTGNISMAGNIENPTLVLNVSDPTAPTLLIKGEEVEATYIYGLWGNFDGSANWSAIDMTEKDGKWVSAATEVADCSFGIRQLDAASGSQVNWLSSAGEADVTVGTAMPVKVEGNNFDLAAGTYVFTFDVDAMTLLVSEEGDVPTPPVVEAKDLYLVGGFNGWDLNSSIKFEKENNVYTLVLEDGLTGEWKITDGSWAYNFGAGNADALESGVEADAWFGSSLNFNSSFSGKTTIVFTLVEESDVDSSIPSKIVVTAEGVAEPDPIEDWYVSVVGDFNTWTADGVHPTTEGLVEFTDLQIGNSEFKVKVWDGLADNWYSTGEAVALNTPTTIAGNNDINMTIEGAEEGQYFDVTFNVLTNTLTVNTASGVSAIAVENGEAVYFNLQGMQVENPVNGIFVKVCNGKAVKVVK